MLLTVHFLLHTYLISGDIKIVHRRGYLRWSYDHGLFVFWFISIISLCVWIYIIKYIRYKRTSWKFSAIKQYWDLLKHAWFPNLLFRKTIKVTSSNEVWTWKKSKELFNVNLKTWAQKHVRAVLASELYKTELVISLITYML